MASSSLTAGKHRSGVIKQITKTNFAAALQQIKIHIQNSDFIAVSSQKTGDFSSSSSSPWRRVLPIDTLEIAYLKSKRAAETFQLLQFAICPFRIAGDKIHAFPYNFHLFPRDELSLGMPSYSFSCQTSFLTSMAQEGFDFNTCIYDGISYLSKAQESKAKRRNPSPQLHPTPASSVPSVADSLFMGRIKSRVEHWRNACNNQDNATDNSLVATLRKLVLKDELYGSRPCMTIDVCSDRQVQLALQIVGKISDDLVPLVVPDEKGGPKSVRVVLTSSNEDKNLLMAELEKVEQEKNLKFRGFREVIDLISSSKKPIIAYNTLHDFTFIHSKFIAPLPPNMNEFMCSLELVFKNVVDVSHLSKAIGPLRKAKNLPAIASYLKRQFFVPLELEFPQEGNEENQKNHGHNVLRITSLFAKLCYLLNIAPRSQNTNREQNKSIDDFSNIFRTTCTSLSQSSDQDIGLASDNDTRRKVSTNNLVFLWGFGVGVTASNLKQRLQTVFENFELQLVDKTCAVVVFGSKESAKDLLKAFKSGETGSSALIDMIADGLKGAGYQAYEKACKLDLCENDLADSLEVVLVESDPANSLSASLGTDSSEIYWDSELMIDLNDL